MAVEGITKKVYLPLGLGEAPSAACDSRLSLMVMSSVDLEEVYVTIELLSGAPGNGRVLVDGAPVRLGVYPADRPIRLPLVLVADGLYRIEVGAKLRDGRVSTLELFVLRTSA